MPRDPDIRHRKPTDPHTDTTIAVPDKIGGFLNDQGLPGHAVRLHERTLADHERVLGGVHPVPVQRNRVATITGHT
ncbi:tetratricopeptide repeat protein [Nocardia sp. BMG111209]|uniref:tetratricopeptide repeat protein n=1 Tax=Nocardia sp. BMG111209 TaxID=1160137 RepID=UPI003510CD69